MWKYDLMCGFGDHAIVTTMLLIFTRNCLRIHDIYYCNCLITHDKINGHREVTASSRWGHRELTVTWRWAQGELTVTTVVTAPGPNDHGSVTARRGHNLVTARSQLSQG